MSLRARHAAATLGMAFVAGLAACSPAGQPSPPTATITASPSPTQAPSPTVALSPSVSPSSSASAATGGTLCAREFEMCEIAAGTYVVTPFTPAFSVTIPDGLTNARNWPTGGGFANSQGGFWWASDVRAAVKDDAQIELEPTTDGFLDHLRSFEEFTVTEPVPTSVGGVDGVAVDVTTGASPARGLYLIPEDAYNLDPGAKARFHLVDHGGTTVLFIFEAYRAADFDAIETQFQPLLDSVTWS